MRYLMLYINVISCLSTAYPVIFCRQLAGTSPIGQRTQRFAASGILNQMIEDVLAFLKDSLNAYLKRQNDERAIGAEVEKQPVVFPGPSVEHGKQEDAGGGREAPWLVPDRVNMLLLNLEQENTLRPPDRFTAVSATGRVQKIQPDIRLNLLVLFVANYQAYDSALKQLSRIIRHFQRQPVFTRQQEPALAEKQIEQLVVELVTLSISEQHHVWSVLRLHYQPSVLYKVKMVVYQDDAPESPPVVTDIDVNRASYVRTTRDG